MHTHATGEPVARAVAEQTVYQKDSDSVENLVQQRFVISTRFHKNLVLLRVDEIL